MKALVVLVGFFRWQYAVSVARPEIRQRENTGEPLLCLALRSFSRARNCDVFIVQAWPKQFAFFGLFIRHSLFGQRPEGAEIVTSGLKSQPLGSNASLAASILASKLKS